MSGLCVYAIALCQLVICASTQDGKISVEIHPSSQKVAENSPAIFTCVSSVPNAEITWYKSRHLLEEKGEVSIRRTNDLMSVLRIERAEVKIHKKTYTCRVQLDGMQAEKDVSLKVLPSHRLHKYFPHVTPIRSGDDVMVPSNDPGSLHMKCTSTVSGKSTPWWRWIKDDYFDLSLASEGERIKITREGDLIINRATAAKDSGKYMCVAVNNRGSAYGTPVTVNVHEGVPLPKLSDCVDNLGVRSKLGESYHREGDRCTTCTCMEDGSGVVCRSVGCIAKVCPPGQRLEESTDECCVHKCVPITVPPFPPHGDCIDDMGVRSKLGESYKRAGDLCMTCTCMEHTRVLCSYVSCAPRTCPHGQRIKATDECCVHECVPIADHPGEMCIDRDENQVVSGNIYLPKEDPCMKCVCDRGRRGRCMMVACEAPTCNEYISSRDVCCNYTCVDTPTNPSGIKGGCTDYMGRSVRSGEMYQSGTDPCVQCECKHGVDSRCTAIICDAPSCKNYLLIPGTCCGFECVDDESVDIDLDGGCRADDGSFVGNGEPYHPRPDPCVTCTCINGRSERCRSIACYPPPMPCLNPRPVPGVCCQLTCEPPEPQRPTLPILENLEKVVGRVFIQQIGAHDAIVQWKMPEKFKETKSNLTLYCFINTMRPHQVDVFHIGDRPYAILRDLDPNTEYRLMANGTLSSETAFMSTPHVMFSLDGRGRSSFVLSDAIGQVFESRGSIAYESYSLPRKFDPVARSREVKVVLNTDSFHKVEVSKYNEAPCMNQDCGLIRFYVYTMEGESKNVLSLMFAKEQDFTWAKAHL